MIALSLSASVGLAQPLVVKGRVESSNVGVGYATLLSLTDAKCGTIANERGEFELLVARLPQKIIVSALGYADTVLTLTQNTSQPLNIKLKEKPISLPQLTINSTSNATFELGSARQEILKMASNEYYFLQANQVGAGVGTVFDTRKNSGVAHTISVFVVEPKPTKYILTVYALDELGTDYKLYPKKLLIPLINKPVVFMTEQAGWTDIENVSVALPDKYLVVLLTRAESNVPPDNEKKGEYPYCIGRQWPNGAAKRHIYVFGDRYATMAKNDDISAIYISCQK